VLTVKSANTCTCGLRSCHHDSRAGLRAIIYAVPQCLGFQRSIRFRIRLNSSDGMDIARELQAARIGHYPSLSKELN
jgi:hypothetical protein